MHVPIHEGWHAGPTSITTGSALAATHSGPSRTAAGLFQLCTLGQPLYACREASSRRCVGESLAPLLFSLDGGGVGVHAYLRVKRWPDLITHVVQAKQACHHRHHHRSSVVSSLACLSKEAWFG